MKALSGIPLCVLLIFSIPGAAMTVEKLTCEQAVNPLGVDVVQPQLSWTLQSAKRGDRQTAYEILAASSESLLRKGAGNLWDSETVSSYNTVQIAFA